MSDSVTATGQFLSPIQGQAIATIPAGSLPAGLYDVVLQAHYGGTTAVAVERNNIGLLKGAITAYVLPIPGQAASNSYMMPASPPIRMYLDGKTAITAIAIAAGTATANYAVGIVATIVGAPVSQ